MNLKNMRPAVDRRVLIAQSGITWIIVGLILCNFAIGWLSLKANGLLFGISGFLISLFVHHFGFLRIVNNNINRILQMEKKVCIFAFQAWKSYLMIGIMVTAGIVLRNLPIPKQYLSVIYIGIGFALILSSFRYLRIFLTLVLKTEESSGT